MMTREEILAKSRQENKERDPYEKSVDITAERIALYVMHALTILLTTIRFLKTGEPDVGLWLIMLTGDAVMYIYTAFKLRTKKAITESLLFLALDALVLFDLF